MRFLQRILTALQARGRGDLSPRCAVCARVAATIELSGRPGAWHLRYSGPGGSNGNGDRIPDDEADSVRRAFTRPYAVATIRAAGFHDDAGFCIECAKFYCPTHWSMSSIGGGRCPAGHFKSLDPHWSPD